MSIVDLPRYRFERPNSLDALCQLLADHSGDPGGVELLAGGTDLMVQISQGAVRPDPLPRIVDVSQLDALRGIEARDDVLRIGAAATYAEIARHPSVRERLPLLAEMTLDVGGPTIQARGTLGGNLATASPAADGVAAIAAFDPTVEVKSVRGVRRIAFADLQTGYKQSTRANDEAIVAIDIPWPDPSAVQLWRKVGTRLAQAISKVALAAVAKVEDGRITSCGLAMASVAPVTALLPKTRALLTSKPLAELDDAAIGAAVDADVSPIDDVRSTGRYRAHCARQVVRTFVASLPR